MTSRDPRFFLLCGALVTLGACGDDGAIPPDASADVSVDGMSMCPMGSTDCDGECVDTMDDRDNCGACGTACGAGEACVSGACSVVCPGTQTVCDGACADTATDRANCGACGTACASGEICVSGSCELSCPPGQAVCDGACVDTQSDPRYCGGCDTACAAGDVCSTGACAANCGAGLTDCGGACVSTADDPAHCGGCDLVCPADAGAMAACGAGGCRQVCGPLVGDCNGDLATAGGDGCETTLATDAANCGICGLSCVLANATAGCDMGGCVVTTCDTGFDDCDMMASNGCESELARDRANCGSCGMACGAGERCDAGTCIAAVGEDCSVPFVLASGTNSITWAATTNDYLTGTIPCASSFSADGPDVVLSYTAAADERVALSFTKPTSTRWAAIASSGACGTLTPRISCMSEFSADTMTGDFVLSSGETAYIYVVDTTSGTAPLDNPLVVDVTATACSDPAPVTVDPPTGSTTTTRTPTFTATFGAPVLTTSGTFTITGDMGAALSYDLSTSPAEVSFSSGNTVVEIDPGVAFGPGERLTLTWTGVRAVVCTTAVAVPPPTWVVDIIAPPCTPGMGGIVGSTTARIAAPSAIGSEYYVAADESPTGYVYFGGTSNLFRVPKAGGVVEDVEAAAGIGFAQLGYAMLVDGLNIYTVESTTSSTADRLIRISSDGGATWVVENYASFATTPGDDFRAATAHAGRIYLVTEEDSTGVDTEIWSVDAAATVLPDAAVLELSIAGEGDCNAIARDTSFYYLACDDGGDRLVRVPVGGGASQLITDALTVNFTVNSLFGEDTGGDGVYDVLYLQSGTEEIFYICDPTGATPFADVLINEGTGTSNYGMGFDRTAGILYMYDDDTDEIVSVQ